MIAIPVADPGFPVGGGVDLVGGAVDPRGSYVSKILHVKMKESGPVGGGGRAGRAPLDPPMNTNVLPTVQSYSGFYNLESEFNEKNIKVKGHTFPMHFYFLPLNTYSRNDESIHLFIIGACIDT